VVVIVCVVFEWVDCVCICFVAVVGGGVVMCVGGIWRVSGGM